MTSIPELLDLAITAALEAGSVIMDVYESEDFDVAFKSDHSPLTKADKAAHDVIIKHLSLTELPILSEEGSQIPYTERVNWSYFWLVDPLDGTKEFIKRNGEFTVNIALMKDGIPIVGVVYAPFLDWLYSGSKDTGVSKVEASTKTKLNPRDNQRSLESLLQQDEVIVVASKNHMNTETEGFIAKFKKANLQSMGSSLKLMLLAEGKADIYPRLGPTMEWDTAASHAILNSLGMRVYQSNLIDELIYNKPDLLNPHFIAF